MGTLRSREVDCVDWVEFLAATPDIRSSTAICLKIKAPNLNHSDFITRLTGLLAQEDIAYDVGAYRSAPPGLRIWGGATVETADMEALLPWLDWAFDLAKKDQNVPSI